MGPVLFGSVAVLMVIGLLSSPRARWLFLLSSFTPLIAFLVDWYLIKSLDPLFEATPWQLYASMYASYGLFLFGSLLSVAAIGFRLTWHGQSPDSRIHRPSAEEDV